MNVFGELVKAQMELLAADPSAGIKARIFYNTTSDLMKVDNGTVFLTMVDLATAQTLTNKTLSGASIQAPVRSDVKQDTLANLVIYAGTAANGQLVFATDTKDYYSVVDSALVILAEGGSAGVEFSLLNNLGVKTSVAASALTIDLVQQDGATDPDATGFVSIGFRDATTSVGGINIRTVAAALTMVVPSGATLGSVNATEQIHYIYAIDNAGTVELAISGVRHNEKVVQTTVALSGASDDIGVLYSTTLRSNVPIRLIGRVKSTQATAGTWATNASDIFAGQVNDTHEAVIASYSTAAGQAVTSGNIIDFGTKVLDSHNAVTTGASWKFTAPKTEVLRVSAAAITSTVTPGAINQYFFLHLRKNGGLHKILGGSYSSQAAAAINFQANGVALVSVVKGDTLDIRMDETLPAVNLLANATSVYVDIESV